MHMCVCVYMCVCVQTIYTYNITIISIFMRTTNTLYLKHLSYKLVIFLFQLTKEEDEEEAGGGINCGNLLCLSYNYIWSPVFRERCV